MNHTFRIIIPGAVLFAVEKTAAQGFKALHDRLITLLTTGEVDLCRDDFSCLDLERVMGVANEFDGLDYGEALDYFMKVVKVEEQNAQRFRFYFAGLVYVLSDECFGLYFSDTPLQVDKKVFLNYRNRFQSIREMAGANWFEVVGQSVTDICP